MPKVSDDLVLGALGTVAKRLEVSLKKVRLLLVVLGLPFH